MRLPKIPWPTFSEQAEPNVKVRRDGDHQFLGEYACNLDDELILIPPGRISDASSWWSVIPGPNWRYIARAGYVHDEIWKTHHLGTGGRKVGYFEGNWIWFKVAISGTRKTRCPLPWALVGLLGLTLGGWVSWWRYRRAD